MPAKFLKNNQHAFTLVELLASIAIITALVVALVPFVANYLGAAQKTTNSRTLASLNEALNEYKALGGLRLSHSLNGDNGTEEMQAILEALAKGITVGNVRKNFLSDTSKINASQLYASGQGKTFAFVAYGTGTAASGSFPGGTERDKPLGTGIMSITSGTTGALDIEIYSSSSYIGVNDSTGNHVYWRGHLTVNSIAGTPITFWSAAGATDSTISGNIDTIIINNQNLTAVNLANAKGLGNLNLHGNDLKTLNLKNLPALTSVQFGLNLNLTSLDLSGCTSLQGISFYGSGDANNNLNSLKTVNLSGCTALDHIVHGSWIKTIESINISGCSALKEIDLNNNKLTSINFNNSPLLEKINLSGNQLSGTIDFSSCTQLTELQIGTNQLTKVTLPVSHLLTKYYVGGNQITGALDVTNQHNLTDFWYAMNPNLTSVDISGCTSLPILGFYGDAPNLTSLTTVTANGCTALARIIHGWAAPSMQSIRLQNCPNINEIEISGSHLSAAALDQLYTDLPALSGTINVSGSTGASSDTPSIATTKGWTVNGT